MPEPGWHIFMALSVIAFLIALYVHNKRHPSDYE